MMRERKKASNTTKNQSPNLQLNNILIKLMVKLRWIFNSFQAAIEAMDWRTMISPQAELHQVSQEPNGSNHFNLVMYVFLGILFYSNPFIWWISSRFRVSKSPPETMRGHIGEDSDWIRLKKWSIFTFRNHCIP